MTHLTWRRRLGALLLVLAMVAGAAACGDDGADDEAGGSTGDTSSAGDGEDAEPSDAGPVGTLRIGEFAPVASYDPAGAQTAQSAYLYPVYDTLTRQAADFSVQPSLATEWEQVEPEIWRFTLRDDVVFHDGAAFDAEVVKANLERQASTEGNPNASVFANLDHVEVVDPYTVDVVFTEPSPAFPLEMSMVMGMMVSPNALDTDLTRAPAGSGPWIWQADESQAGVIEVFELNPDYWDPSVQGVERIEVESIADNNARVNALLAGDIDLASSVPANQVADLEAAGMETTNVAAYLPFLIIVDREGATVPALADERVRQAIGYAIDREAFRDTIYAGQGDAIGGFYGPQFADWYDPELDDLFEYDPDKARELLADAGYPDGFQVEMPVMPTISAPVEAIAQMLGQVGIDVVQDPIQAGAIGGYMRGGEAELSWYRALLYYPGKTYGDFVGPALNPLGLDDVADLRDMLAEANATPGVEDRKEIFDEVAREVMERGMVYPLTHAFQTAAWTENVSGPVLGLNMQAPMPYGVRVDG